MLKKIIFLIFISAFFLLAFFLLTNYQKNKDLGKKSLKKKSNFSSFKKNFFTKEEIAKHNKKTDCWLIINQKVYQVTDFIDKHPGGLIISFFCGKDASLAFITKGEKNKPHSEKAIKMLETMYIGELKNN